MFEVGKKYASKDKITVRECINVLNNCVVLGPCSYDLLPVIIEPHCYNFWQEYKPPLRAKTLYIPILQWRNSKSEPVIAIQYAGYTKESTEKYVERHHPDYTLLDIIEVTWEEK